MTELIGTLAAGIFQAIDESGDGLLSEDEMMLSWW